MKIGILTHPLELNYGAVMQNFALQKVLSAMGHDVYTIDRHNVQCFKNVFFQLLSFLKRNLLHMIGNTRISTKWNPFISLSEKKKMGREIRQFVESNINLTREVYSDELELIDNVYNFDAYIVGSDQVWLKKYCPGSFLDFVQRENVKKIFYAASTGADVFFSDEKITKICKKLAKSFSAISVREYDLVELCKLKLDCSASFVLDPVFLLDDTDYINVMRSSFDKEENFVFSYMLDKSEDKDKICNYIANSLGLPIVTCNAKCDYKKTSSGEVPDECVKPGIEYWLNCIKNSDVVITDSFHGMVFSIVFKKKFFVIENKARGVSRIRSLSKLLGIEDRIICSNNMEKSIVETSIDYKNVYKTLSMMRKQSIEFLISSLS